MINEQRVVALVPLRGGSKSIKDKNLCLLGGKPLLAWPINIALQTPEIDRVIVSTDSEIIANNAKSYGAEVYLRPKELATDSALVIDVIRQLGTTLRQEGENASIMLLLEATSPFRDVALIQRCLYRLIEEKLDSIATFQRAEINPHRTWEIKNNSPQPFVQEAIPWLPRQCLPDVYQLNGAVYAFLLDKLLNDASSLLFGKKGAEIMESKSIDIDSEEDLIVANVLFKARMLTETV